MFIERPKRRGRNVNNLIAVSKVNNDHDININRTKSNSQTKPNMPAILLTNACHALGIKCSEFGQVGLSLRSAVSNISIIKIQVATV